MPNLWSPTSNVEGSSLSTEHEASYEALNAEEEEQQQQSSSSSEYDTAHSIPQEKQNPIPLTVEMTKRGTGEITALDPYRGIGFVDSLYRFETIEHGNKNLVKGARVNFIASQRDGVWEIDDICVYEEASTSTQAQATAIIIPTEEKDESEMFNEQRGAMIGEVESHMCQVTTLLADVFFIVFNNDPFPIEKKFFSQSPLVMEGDWLKVEFKVKGRKGGKSISELKSVNWAERGTRSGTLEKDNEFYFIEEIVVPVSQVQNAKLHVNSKCKVTYVLSERESTRRHFNKRSLKIEKLDNGNNDTPLDNDSLQLLFESKHNIVINPTQMEFGSHKINSTVNMKFEVLNRGDKRTVLKSVMLRFFQDVCEFKINIPKRESRDIIKVLDPMESAEVEIECTPKLLGRTTEICLFDFDNCRIGRKITIKCLLDNPSSFPSLSQSSFDSSSITLGKYNQDRRNKKTSRLHAMINDIELKGRREVDRGPAAVRAPYFLPFRLPSYPIPEDIMEVYLKETTSQGSGTELLLEKYPHIDWTTLNSDNHADRFMTSLYLEELECRQLRKELDIRGAIMQKDFPEKLLYFPMPSSTDTKPCRQGEKVRCVFSDSGLDLLDFSESEDSEDSSGGSRRRKTEQKKKQTESDYKLKIKEGYIYKIFSQEVYVKFSDEFFDRYDSEPVDISFLQSRRLFRKQLHGVIEAKRLLGKNWLFPTKETAKLQAPKIMFVEVEASDSEPKLKHVPRRPFKDDLSKSSTARPLVDTRLCSQFKHELRLKNEDEIIMDVNLQWFNPVLNPEQKNAVRRVLRGQCRPLPYIIFGPPGTGKTCTVIECVRQVYKLDKQSRILIAVPSNQAGDLIAERLALTNDYLPGDFVRFNGFLRAASLIPEKIRSFCYDGENLNALVKHRIIIATISTAGQFLSLNINPGHFTHVFIDEAGFATEPETLMACVMAAVDKQGQVILAGDPSQLVPTLYHNSEVHQILRRSMLERFMVETDVYSYDVEHGYNASFITMFTRTYRLPPVLLKTSSLLFYHDVVVSEKSVNEELLERLHQCGILKEKQPLLFHGISSQSSRGESHSWSNNDQAIYCIKYVQRLKENGLTDDDIGVISLYRKQVEKIKIALRGINCSSKVATIHEFQGGEKKVVILSTVISHPNPENFKPTGFLFQTKVFNVSITRASELLIILGDPHTLQKTPWKQILKFSVEMGVYFGCNLPAEYGPALCDNNDDPYENHGGNIIEKEVMNEAKSIVNKDDDRFSDSSDDLYGDSGSDEYDDDEAEPRVAIYNNPFDNL